MAQEASNLNWLVVYGLGTRKGRKSKVAEASGGLMSASEKGDDHTNGRNVVALSRHSWGDR